MIPKPTTIKDKTAPPTWRNLPEPLRQQVVAQLVKLLVRQISPPSQEVSDEPPSQDQR